MAENEMGKKVSFHLTNANEVRLREIQDHYLEDTGVVTQAFVLNRALAYLYEKEFKKNRGKSFTGQEITEYTIIERDERYIIKLGKHLYYNEHNSNGIVTTKDSPCTYLMSLPYAQETIDELKNNYDNHSRILTESN